MKIVKGKRLVTGFLAVMLFLAASSVFAVAAEPVRTRLPNGMTVIIEEEHTAPVVAIEMWVRVGSADETDNIAGISHVFEHMLFKGTKKRKLGEIAGAVEEVGGEINAYTSFDNTVYHLAVPSRHFPTGLDIISDAIQNSAFDPGELKKELEVVLEEIRMNEDNPGRSLYKAVLSSSYEAHPYRRPVIGFEDTVRTFTRERILEFFRKWYIPNNMTLVIVGDVPADEALKSVKAQFSNFRKGKDLHRPRPVEPPQRALKARIVSKEVKEAQLGLAFHIPELRSGDTYSIDVLAGILGGGASSRLTKRLKIDESVVHSVSAYAMSLKDPGLLFITAALEAKNAGKALKESIREIMRLGYEGPNPDELEKVKLNIGSEFIYGRETMQGIAGKLGHYESAGVGLAYEKEYLEGIRNVTAGDVRQAVLRYLAPEGMTAVMLTPKAEQGVMTADSLAGLLKTSFAEAEKEYLRAGEKEDGVTKVMLDNGTTLIVKEAHANQTVAFYAAFPGGLRYETPGDNGVGNFMAAMLTRGTGKRTREEIAKETEALAGGVGGFSGWNTTGVSAQFLSNYFDKGLEIFADVLLNPSFPDDEREKTRNDVLASIKSQEDSLPSYTFKLLYRALFKDHPYGMPVLGTEETVKRITREDLARHHRAFFNPKGMVFVIAGDVRSEYALQKVKALFRDFKAAGAPIKGPQWEERQDRIRTTGDVREKAQTNIGIGFQGVIIGTPESYAMRVLNEILSGQSGRLFVELRDKESLAYSLSAFSREAADPGVFGVYIASAPEKKDAAIKGVLRELKRMTEERATDDEMRRARNSLIGGYEIGLQEVSSQASDMANNELFGLGYGFSKVFPEKIGAVTTEDVLQAARKYITLDAYTISVVGPDGAKGRE